MKNDIKIRYNSAFGTIHTRDYYKGKSFHYSGKWTSGAHYLSDDYDVDFIVKDNCLLACAQSHYATIDNEPKNFLYDEYGTPIGIASRYWDFVLTGLKGIPPRIKVEDDSWWVSYDDGATWSKLADFVLVNWGNETSDDVVLTINNISKTISKPIDPISDREIDAILNEFDIEHYVRE